MNKYNIITILGPTASGKTRIAACLADRVDGEVISADSRQVYTGMDLGTGKDLNDYKVEDRQIPCHLIDIADPGYEYNVYEYQRDFIKVFNEIHGRQKLPVLCGGSGLYIEAILKGYRLINVPVNRTLRKDLEGRSMDEMQKMLSAFKPLHNITDTEKRKRLVRAIEIEEYYSENPEVDSDFPELNTLVVGIKYDRESTRRRITGRLKQRLDEGMLAEAEALLASGLTYEQLMYYGLEYKYLALHLNGDLDYDTMFARLNTAIHQFAKRQMTWYRRMERNGISIRWLDGYMPVEEKLKKIIEWSAAG
ncbi:MAG: tRNA (adenosine(37)-N6)-dimethylallyltransferase MiaA [Bacteroidales bacterium]|nr:tRNA (adenosine(37)-N6)-dimethylallyltransferase MiaA [Bacteroidales bacterium]